MDIESFKAELTSTGYQEVLEKTYAPNQFMEKHKHPFRARAVVTAGEMTISWGDTVSREYRVGDIFEIEAGDEHSEQYGPAGATYLVGRRFPT
jgi:quercetin dioxygenase-like cupin family protein